MSQEDLTSAPARELVVPHVPIEENKETTSNPFSFRMYDPLEPVNKLDLAVAAAIADESDRVMTPIGGVLLPGFLVGDDENSRVILEDIIPVPLETDVLPDCQIPLIIEEKPSEEHDEERIVDFGRVPHIGDIMDSVQNPPKEKEMVLALPAQKFVAQVISAMGNGAPNLLHSEVYHNLGFVRRDWCEKDTRFIQLLPYIVFYKKVNGKFQIFVYQRGKGVGEARLAGGCSIGIGGHINPHDFLSAQGRLELSTEKETNPVFSNLGPTYVNMTTGRTLVEGFWSGIFNNVRREGGEEVSIVDRDHTGAVGVAVDLGEYIKQEAKQSDLTPEIWLHERTSFFLDYQAGDVEKVHLAMFIGIEVPSTWDISTNEEELLDVGFIPLDDLAAEAPWATPSALECWSRSIIDSLGDTLKFSEANPDVKGYASNFISKVMEQDGIHPADPEIIAKIDPKDRWKIGTISAIFGRALKFYAMNAYIRA